MAFDSNANRTVGSAATNPVVLSFLPRMMQKGWQSTTKCPFKIG
jgi:hypothetical protein